MDWTEFGTAVGTQLAPIISMLLVAVVTALISVGIAHLKKWTGINVTDKQRDMLTTMAAESVTYAEEQALKALKKADPTPDSDTKMELAVEYVVDQMRAAGIPEMAKGELVKVIESNLMFQRTPEEKAASKRLPETATISEPDGES